MKTAITIAAAATLAVAGVALADQPARNGDSQREGVTGRGAEVSFEGRTQNPRQPFESLTVTRPGPAPEFGLTVRPEGHSQVEQMKFDFKVKDA